MEQMSIKIAGMSCDGCVSSVGNALRRLPGVRVQQVEIGTAVVEYDPELSTPESIRSAIIKAGFEPWAA